MVTYVKHYQIIRHDKIDVFLWKSLWTLNLFKSLNFAYEWFYELWSNDDRIKLRLYGYVDLCGYVDLYG